MGLFDWIELILDILENPICLITGLIIMLLCGGLIFCSDSEDESIGPSQERQLILSVKLLKRVGEPPKGLDG